MNQKIIRANNNNNILELKGDLTFHQETLLKRNQGKLLKNIREKTIIISKRQNFN